MPCRDHTFQNECDRTPPPSTPPQKYMTRGIETRSKHFPRLFFSTKYKAYHGGPSLEYAGFWPEMNFRDEGVTCTYHPSMAQRVYFLWPVPGIAQTPPWIPAPVVWTPGYHYSCFTLHQVTIVQTTTRFPCDHGASPCGFYLWNHALTNYMLYTFGTVFRPNMVMTRRYSSHLMCTHALFPGFTSQP
jgi:hypothetical protein